VIEHKKFVEPMTEKLNDAFFEKTNAVEIEGKNSNSSVVLNAVEAVLEKMGYKIVFYETKYYENDFLAIEKI
jgi:hypothetical protein